MKKLFHLFAFSLFLLTFSCQNDQSDLIELQDDSLNIAEAKNWYNANHSPVIVMNTGASTSLKTSQAKNNTKKRFFYKQIGNMLLLLKKEI